MKTHIKTKCYGHIFKTVCLAQVMRVKNKSIPKWVYVTSNKGVNTKTKHTHQGQ